MIIFDLEWNRGYDHTPLNEILQIGAVRVAQLGGPILDCFNAYIKPTAHKSFDPGAKQLPELRTSLDSDLDFATVIERFRAWCGAETEYASWGGGDLATIDQSCEYWNVPAFTMEKVYNFQTALAFLLGTDQQIALWRAAEYLNIPDTFTFHNALNDALYTALIGRWLTPESLAYQPPRSGRARPAKRKVTLKLSKLPFPKQPRQTVGPFRTAELVLDARESRRPPCPICGTLGYISQWRLTPSRRDKPQQGLSIFSCPEHGRFLCRLVLLPLDNGMWRGRRTVPVIRPELIREYTAVCQSDRVHRCKSLGKNQRSSSSRRRTSRNAKKS